MADKKVVAEFKGKWPLVIILLLALLSRFWHLSFPSQYMFDEVYHAFTAAAYAQNDPRGYEWWHASPVEGTAYEWLHPPLSKLFMAAGILIWGNNSLGWRFFPAVFGVLAIILIYLLGKTIFDSKVGLIAAFFVLCDGLFLTQSQIAMNDIFLVVFILATVYSLWLWYLRPTKKKFLLSCFLTGLALATKWTGVYLLPVFIFFLLARIKTEKARVGFLKKNFIVFLFGFLLLPLIYVFSYSQFWWQEHNWQQFVELHQQTWWYQTNLEATHDYASPAWQWPLMIRPVWFWVDYQEETIANIYNRGNPLIWWGGLMVLPFAIVKAIKGMKTRGRFHLILLLFSYFIFWLPWLLSPRILFIHHYLPALPFLFLLLAWFLRTLWLKSHTAKALVILFLFSILATFLFFYPVNVGSPVSSGYFRSTLWLPSWQ